MRKREVKPVSFSLVDDYEIKLYNHCKSQGSFSRYVKRLIGRDMDGYSVPVATPITQVEKDIDPTSFI